MYIVCVLKIWKMKLTFYKEIIVEHYQLERQTVRMEILLVLIWVQTDLGSSCYQLRLSTDIKVASSKKSVNKTSLSCLYFIHIASLCLYSLSSNCLQR